ncbi:cytochrome b-c1 complex subunit 6-like [Teratosphaeria destructans]|uniref:Cytochrome b-c1 complex subunit 6, mitochondrial n=1 Tax=Teratosphaeria destructans TaxID=418781 RepID=A0A9W7W5J2_9PEZI|nr:cytochrome b-c1 complex subunit 6-like [Teratosphaeria destructans]
MGWYDYLTDLASSFAPSDTHADQQHQSPDPTNPGPEDTSHTQSSGKDARSGGIGTAQHDRDATTRGGVSTKSPHAGTNEESDSEKEANAATAGSAASRNSGDPAKGHTPGEGSEASGQKGAEASGPHGGHVKGGSAKADDAEEDEGGDDEEAEEEEEEEEEEDEPQDPKPALEEECMKTQQCAPLKHHYDECAERVQKQQEETGKADEDCVEEFFHLMHCASQCAAPKLFRQLK